MSTRQLCYSWQNIYSLVATVSKGQYIDFSVSSSKTTRKSKAKQKKVDILCFLVGDPKFGATSLTD